MTLSTSDLTGTPDARILILKDLDEHGWWFATNSESAKGAQLTAQPVAALTFYWPLVGRQVRVRGPVLVGSTELSAADFRSRGSGARAVALAGHESQPLTDRATCERAVADAAIQLAAQPDLVAPAWQVYAVADGWTHTLLWPQSAHTVYHQSQPREASAARTRSRSNRYCSEQRVGSVVGRDSTVPDPSRSPCRNCSRARSTSSTTIRFQ
jgi:hypothetical protein